MSTILNTPLDKATLSKLNSGDSVLLSGVIYTARDAAHKKLCELIANGEKLPIELDNAIIYYAGPTPASPNSVIGSVGPTTSGRMDAYAETLMDAGVCAMIGKGMRSIEVNEAIASHGAVYFASIGGAGALISRCVKSAQTVAFGELGTEAVRRLTVEDMPLTVAVDSRGNDLYKTGRREYLAFAEANQGVR